MPHVQDEEADFDYEAAKAAALAAVPSFQSSFGQSSPAPQRQRGLVFGIAQPETEKSDDEKLRDRAARFKVKPVLRAGSRPSSAAGRGRMEADGEDIAVEGGQGSGRGCHASWVRSRCIQWPTVKY